MPRFAAEHYAANLTLWDSVRGLAAEAGCTVAQLALAWLLSRGDHILPIPGTTSATHLRENAAAASVRLSAAHLAKVDTLINTRTVTGSRYSAQANGEVDTEGFDPPAG